MVAPVTGPFSKLVTALMPPNGGYRPVWLHDSKTWYRQRRPYNLPLSFSRERKLISCVNTAREYYQSKAYETRYGNANAKSNAHNEAYTRFIAKIKPDQAELGAALGERKSALEMIAKRGLQFTSFLRAVKRFRFGDAAKALGLSRAQVPKGLRAKGRAFSSNVLEYSFGWAPLVGDIGNAVETLQKGVPPSLVRGRATERFAESFVGLEGVNTKTHTIRQTIGVQYGAKVLVSNPNLFLANQLGFVNPVAVVWELIPFSFLVDYVVNVSDFLNSFTDLWGVSLIDQYATEVISVHSDETLFGPTVTPPRLWTGDTRIVNRWPGAFLPPGLRIQQWSLSPQRATTSIALLLQQLR
jgi:hypothetical protein